MHIGPSGNAVSQSSRQLCIEAEESFAILQFPNGFSLFDFQNPFDGCFSAAAAGGGDAVPESRFPSVELWRFWPLKQLDCVAFSYFSISLATFLLVLLMLLFILLFVFLL